jgi:hypothetical protein
LFALYYAKSKLYTYGAAASKLIVQHAEIVHRPVNVAAGRQVIAGIYHIQNVNTYDIRLKQWMPLFNV